ncbi:MAG: glutathione S-transferase family protein [Pacificimonas sp.]
MITLYWAPQTRSGRALWALEEVAQKYEIVPIDIRAEDRRDPKSFRAASPLGKVPAIVDNVVGTDIRVADSAAIALYLAERYAPGSLAPKANGPSRGEFLTWLFSTPSVIEPAMAEKFAGLEPNPTSYAWGSFDKMVAAMEARLDGREWVVAERFTMADLMLAGSIEFMSMFGILEPTPVLKTYMDRCLARPAAVRARERDAEEAAKLEA